MPAVAHHDDDTATMNEQGDPGPSGAEVDGLEWNAPVDTNKFAASDRIVDAILRRRAQRKAEEAAAQVRIAAQAARDAEARGASAAAAAAGASAEDDKAAAARRAGAAAGLRDMEEAVNDELAGGPGAGRTAAPEPATLEAVIVPTTAPEPVECGDIPPVQRFLETNPHLTSWEAMRLFLSQRGALPRPPDAATARAVFAIACRCTEPQTARDAAGAFLEWCGVAPLAAADCCLSIDSLDLEGAPPPPCTPWVPGASDFLEAFHSLGVSKPAAASHAGGGKRGAAAAAAAAANAAGGEGAGAGGDLAYRDANLPVVLQLLAAVASLSASGRLPAMHLPEGHGRQLVAALVHLHTDPRARAAALPQLHEATAAVIGAFGATEWGRVLPDLAARLAAPLGPSHRAAIGVLSELSVAGGSGGGGRCAALQRAGALQLLQRLVQREGEAQAAKPSGRGGASSVTALAAVQALGRDRKDLAALLQRLTPSSGSGKGGGSKAGGKGGDGDAGAVQQRRAAPDFWALQSALEAADLVLWSFVDQPEGSSLDSGVTELFLCHLGDLSRLLKSHVSAHHVRARLAELTNVYSPDFMAQLPVPGE